MVVMDPSSTKPVAVNRSHSPRTTTTGICIPPRTGFQSLTRSADIDPRHHHRRRILRHQYLGNESQAHPDADHPLGGVNYDGYLIWTASTPTSSAVPTAANCTCSPTPTASCTRSITAPAPTQPRRGARRSILRHDAEIATVPIARAWTATDHSSRSGRRRSLRRPRDAHRRIVQAPHRGVRHGSQEGPVQPRRGKARRPVDLGCPLRR